MSDKEQNGSKPPANWLQGSKPTAAMLGIVALALADCAQPAPSTMAPAPELDPGFTRYCGLPQNVGHWPCHNIR